MLQCLTLASTAPLIGERLPGLYRSLRRTTVAKPMLSQRGLVGAPLWPETLRVRTAAGGDPTLFVVASTARSSDVPENRGLAACLGYLESLLSRWGGQLGDKRLPLPLQIIARETRYGLHLPALRDLPRDKTLSVHARAAMDRNRDPTFRFIAELTESLQATQGASDAEVAATLAGAGWFSPLSDDALFELFNLINVIQIISDTWGDPAHLRSIRLGEAVAIWHLPGDREIAIYFNSLPDQLRKASRYLRVSRNHGNFFNASSRRPDIIVKTSKAGKSSFTLFEIKNPSEDNLDYRRDSLYKCFAYLHDFSKIFDQEQGSDLCFLVFPDKVPKGEVLDEKVVVVSGDDYSALKDRFTGRIKRSLDSLV